MNLTQMAWGVVFLAVLAANAPFMTNRVLWFGAPAMPKKSVRWHVLELALAYASLGFLLTMLEGFVGQGAEKGWQFYAITVCLFLVFATPGFVYRYALKKQAS